MLVSSPTNLEGLYPSNPPWNGTINFLVERLIVDPAGLTVSPAPESNDAEGCCFWSLRLNAVLSPLVVSESGNGRK